MAIIGCRQVDKQVTNWNLTGSVSLNYHAFNVALCRGYLAVTDEPGIMHHGTRGDKLTPPGIVNAILSENHSNVMYLTKWRQIFPVFPILDDSHPPRQEGHWMRLEFHRTFCRSPEFVTTMAPNFVLLNEPKCLLSGNIFIWRIVQNSRQDEKMKEDKFQSIYEKKNFS